MEERVAPTYKIVLRNKAGEDVAELPQSTDISCGWYLNAPGAVVFQLPKRESGLAPQDITLGYTEVFVYRNSTLIHAGEILTRSGARVNSTVEYGAKGWLAQLEARLLGDNQSPLIYTATDPADIIEAILAWTQFGTQGDLGLTMGAKATTRPRDRNYQYETVRTAIEGLSASKIIDGIDFEITPNKVVDTFFPKGQLLSSIRFELGKNVLDYWITEDASELTNKVTILGAGNGVSMLTATDTAPDYLLDTYKIRHRALSFKDVSNPATLDDRAQAERIQRQVPKQILSLHVDAQSDPPWGAYAVGDTVYVKINDGLNQVDGWYRIYGLELNRSDLGKETVKIIFNPS